MKNKKVSKNVFENIIIAVCIMIYFIIINALYYNIQKNVLLIVLKVLSMVVLTFSIIIMEYAYRKDSGKRAINAIEILVIAAYTLSIAHIVEAQKLSFVNYILASSYIFSIYFLFKAICVYTKEQKEHLNSYSDIKEIVTNEPTKKIATKKSEDNN